MFINNMESTPNTEESHLRTRMHVLKVHAIQVADNNFDSEYYYDTEKATGTSRLRISTRNT